MFGDPKVPRFWEKNSTKRVIVKPLFFCVPQMLVKTGTWEQCPQMLAGKAREKWQIDPILPIYNPPPFSGPWLFIPDTSWVALNSGHGSDWRMIVTQRRITWRTACRCLWRPRDCTHHETRGVYEHCPLPHLNCETFCPLTLGVFHPTLHAKSPMTIFGDFNGLPPDSRRLSIHFDRCSVILNQFQSFSISFNQF